MVSPLPVTSRLPAGALCIAGSAAGATTSRTTTWPLPVAPGKRARKPTASSAAVPSAVTAPLAAVAPAPTARET